MIKRHRIFKKDEKKGLAKILMLVHFSDFKKFDTELDNSSFFYSNKNGYKITINYEDDSFSYTGNVDKKNILSFKIDYENEMARKLNVIKDDSRFTLP